MLLLFETPAGYALFKTSSSKLAKVENIFEVRRSPHVLILQTPPWRWRS